MVTLTDEQAEEIQNKLREYWGVVDNQLYHSYSVQGLKDELDEINDLIFMLEDK